MDKKQNEKEEKMNKKHNEEKNYNLEEKKQKNNIDNYNALIGKGEENNLNNENQKENNNEDNKIIENIQIRKQFYINDKKRMFIRLLKIIFDNFEINQVFPLENKDKESKN